MFDPHNNHALLWAYLSYETLYIAEKVHILYVQNVKMIQSVYLVIHWISIFELKVTIVALGVPHIFPV